VVNIGVQIHVPYRGETLPARAVRGEVKAGTLECVTCEGEVGFSWTCHPERKRTRILLNVSSWAKAQPWSKDLRSSIQPRPRVPHLRDGLIVA